LDFVDALHQQEIAAEYYARREGIMNNDILADAIGTSAATEGQNAWDKEHVPLDATLAHGPPQTGSRFKKSRQKPFAPRSLEGSILPASTLRGAVRMGKVEDGELVGPGDDSEDELATDVEEKLAIGAARQHLLRSSTSDSMDTHSDSGTPIMNDPRSSPKLRPDEEIAYQAPVSPNPRTPKSPLATAPPIFPSSSKLGQPFTNPQTSQVTGSAQGLGFSSMIIESPSFAPPPSQKPAPQKAPSIMADTVRESAPRQSSAVPPTSTSRAPPKVSRFKAARS